MGDPRPWYHLTLPGTTQFPAFNVPPPKDPLLLWPDEWGPADADHWRDAMSWHDVPVISAGVKDDLGFEQCTVNYAFNYCFRSIPSRAARLRWLWQATRRHQVPHSCTAGAPACTVDIAADQPQLPRAAGPTAAAVHSFCRPYPSPRSRFVQRDFPISLSGRGVTLPRSTLRHTWSVPYGSSESCGGSRQPPLVRKSAQTVGDSGGAERRGGV